MDIGIEIKANHSFKLSQISVDWVPNQLNVKIFMGTISDSLLKHKEIETFPRG